MDAKLVVVGGDAKAAEISLKLPVIIGRGREASLTLPHPLVSRKHCQLYESGGFLTVRDLGSLNGTYINNRRIDEEVLPPGELLTLGTVTFRAIYTPQPTTVPTADQSASSAAIRPPEVISGSSGSRSNRPLEIFRADDSAVKDAETEALQTDEEHSDLGTPDIPAVEQ